MFRKIFNKWNAFNKCHVCGCTESITENPYYCADHVLCEYDVVCECCGTKLNHWAYGYMQWPECRTEAISEVWWHPYSTERDKLKCIVKLILRLDKMKP